MKTVIKLSYVFCLIILLGSCKRNVAPSEYSNIVNSSKELNKKIRIHDIEYTFSFIPKEEIALRSCMKKDGNIDAAQFHKRMQELENIVFINLKMQLQDGNGSLLKYHLTDRSEYEKRVMYYEFYAKEDIRLLSKGTEIPPQSYQYENHMDLMPYNTMVMAFSLSSKNDDFQIVFNDRAFENLFLKANFKQADIDGLPKLILN